MSMMSSAGNNACVIKLDNVCLGSTAFILVRFVTLQFFLVTASLVRRLRVQLLPTIARDSCINSNASRTQTAVQLRRMRCCKTSMRSRSARMRTMPFSRPAMRLWYIPEDGKTTAKKAPLSCDAGYLSHDRRTRSYPESRTAQGS